MSLLDDFPKFAESQKGFRGSVLAFDPGETTGWAFFHNYRLIDSGQIQTGTVPLAFKNVASKVSEIIKRGQDAGYKMVENYAGNQHDPELHKFRMVIEDYRIYSWKSDSHKWAQIHTIKVVAACEVAAILTKTPYRLRMAQHAKGFCTDDRMERWGFWKVGQRHARDAIRHATLYIIDPNRSKGDSACGN